MRSLYRCGRQCDLNFVFRDLLPFVCRRLDVHWAPRVYMTDACESGYAFVSAMAPASLIKHVGQWHERWRYKAHRYTPGRGPRSLALGGRTGPTADANTEPLLSEAPGWEPEDILVSTLDRHRFYQPKDFPRCRRNSSRVLIGIQVGLFSCLERRACI